MQQVVVIRDAMTGEIFGVVVIPETNKSGQPAYPTMSTSYI